MGMRDFQREGSISNSHVGRSFEEKSQKVLAREGLRMEPDHKVPCGLGARRKNHAFDLGSEIPKVIVECKSHTWTSGGNVPSAKMTNWAEAMFYFSMAPRDYRKIFIVERSIRSGSDETLLGYFLRTRSHMIPPDVEFWELDSDSDELTVYEV